jgi:peptide/nickel transport system ATP-binding protein
MTLLAVDNLSVIYNTPRGPLKAVDSVDFILNKGKSLGLVGESGSGKSTIGTAIMGLLPKNAEIPNGRIEFNQIDLISAPGQSLQKIRWNKIAMIFQAAMNALNPIQRVGDQIAEAIVHHAPGASPERAIGNVHERVAELFALVGIPAQRRNDYPHQYSGGMRQRAVIAMALACGPEVIIADEPTTALDMIVQDQILETIKSLQRKLGIGILFISHDISVVADVCHHIGVMYAGQLVELGTREEVFVSPAHPYTQSLMAAHITLAKENTPRPIPGKSPDMVAPPPGCRFCDRCDCAGATCSIEAPQWRQLSPTHKIRCCGG